MTYYSSKQLGLWGSRQNKIAGPCKDQKCSLLIFFFFFYIFPNAKILPHGLVLYTMIFSRDRLECSCSPGLCPPEVLSCDSAIRVSPLAHSCPLASATRYLCLRHQLLRCIIMLAAQGPATSSPWHLKGWLWAAECLYSFTLKRLKTFHFRQLLLLHLILYCSLSLSLSAPALH